MTITALVAIWALIAATQPAVQDDSLDFELLSVRDDVAGVEAFKLLVPSGWEFKGGVRWLMNSTQLTETAFSVSKPDGSASLEFLPERLFHWSEIPLVRQAYTGQVPVLKPLAAAQYLEKVFIPQERGNCAALKVVRIERLPEEVEKANAMFAEIIRNDPCYAALTYGITFSCDAALAEIEYDESGRRILEKIVVLTLQPKTQSGIVTVWGPVRTVSARTSSAEPERDMLIMYTTAGSVTENPLWLHKVCQVSLMLLQEQRRYLDNVAATSRYISRTADEISDMLYSSYRMRDRAYDRIFTNFAEYMRGPEQRYGAERDFEFALPGSCRSAWTNGRRYRLNFDSDRSPGQGWRRLEMHRR
jgi:hypothetical protein